MLCGFLRTRSAGVRYRLLLTALSACGRVGIELLPEDVSGQSARDGGRDDGATGPSTGNCSLRCENAHGSAICLDGACVIDCENGYADCDDNPTNGCEADTTSAPDSCGGCTRRCSNAHGGTSCSAGLCTPSCQPGFGDCDDDAASGCEADLAS